MIICLLFFIIFSHASSIGFIVYYQFCRVRSWNKKKITIHRQGTSWFNEAYGLSLVCYSLIPFTGTLLAGFKQ